KIEKYGEQYLKERNKNVIENMTSFLNNDIVPQKENTLPLKKSERRVIGRASRENRFEDRRPRKHILNNSCGGIGSRNIDNIAKKMQSPSSVSTNKRVILRNYGNSITNTTKNIAYMSFMSIARQNEVGQGIETANTAFSVGKEAVKISTALAYNQLTKAYRGQLKEQLKKEFGIVSKTGNINVPKITDLNRILVKNGYAPLKGSGVDLTKLCKRNLKKIIKKGNVPAEVINAYKAGILIGRLNTAKIPVLNLKNIRKMFNIAPIKMVLMREMSETEAGAGLRITTFAFGRVKKTLGVALKVFRNSVHTVIMNAKRAALASMNVKLKNTQKSLKKAQKAYELAKQSKDVKKITKTKKKLDKVTRKNNKINRRTNNRQRRKAKRKNKRNRIFSPLRRLNEIRRAALNKVGTAIYKKLVKVPGFKQAEAVGKAIGKVLGNVGKFFTNVFGGVSHAVRIVAGVFGFIAVALIVVVALMFSASGIYNANNTKNIELASKLLNNLFTADIERVMDLGYEDVEIVYENIRDDEEYKKHKKETKSKDFYESSNCAELLSMAHIWSGYDLDSVDKDEVLSYITSLWHGSHSMKVEVEKTIHIDKDGNESETKKAVLTYTTNFFNSLFDCKLSNEPTPLTVIDGDDDFDSYIGNWDEMYVWLRDNGYNHIATCGIMANLAYETASINDNNCGTFTKATLNSKMPNAENKINTSDGCIYRGICNWSVEDGSWERIKEHIEGFKGKNKDLLSQLKALKRDLNQTAFN
nr:hypothetical protein [Lachnospiraceae bacterium]